jgi:hypothetical protein
MCRRQIAADAISTKIGCFNQRRNIAAFKVVERGCVVCMQVAQHVGVSQFSHEQIVFASQCDRTHCAFGGVVVQLQKAVVRQASAILVPRCMTAFMAISRRRDGLIAFFRVPPSEDRSAYSSQHTSS